LIGIKNFIRKINEKMPVLKPLGRKKLAWEVLMLLIIFWNIFALTLLFTFDIAPHQSYWIITDISNEEGHKLLRYLNIGFLCLFILDIFIKLNSAFFRGGEQVLDRGEIVKKYVREGFFFDFVGITPFIFSIILESSYYTEDYYKYYLLFFLFKLHPLQIFFHNINEELLYLEGKSETIFSLLKLLLKVLAVCHCFACLWHLTALKSSAENNWVTKQGLSNSPWNERYLRSLYYTIVTMTTVGYGDIFPQNQSEMILSFLLMLFGSGLIGYSINSIGTILKKMNKRDNNFR
jgi:hypothetical protein